MGFQTELYDPDNRSGFLLYKLQNMKKLENRKQKGNANDNMRGTAPLTDDEENELILYFKNCVISRQNKEELKAKLKDTVQFRNQLMLRKNINFPETFSFYFASPEMVNYLIPIALLKPNIQI